MHETEREMAQDYISQDTHSAQQGYAHKPWITVLQILPSLNTGGVERGTVDVAQAIVETGGRAIVVSQGGLYQSVLERVGAEHIQLPVASKNPVKMWLNAQKLIKLIKQEGVDVVHARSRAPAWSGAIAAKACKIPFVTSHHGIYKPGMLVKTFYNSVMWKSDKVIAVSQDVQNRLLEKHNVPAEKVALIHRGVDTEYFNPQRIEPQRVIDYMHAHNLPKNMRYVVLPGRISRWKGMHDLIAAMCLVKTNDLAALIVGPSQAEDSYAFQLQKEVMHKQLQNRVFILPDCQDMPHLYSLASIVVSASIEPEPFGRVTAEAMAMGRPVLAPNHGGAAEQIIHNETGWLFEPRNVQDLADGLDYIASLDDQVLDNIGYQAREQVCQYFSKQKMVQQTLDVYAELLERKKKQDYALVR